jgi:hypothetical protein
MVSYHKNSLPEWQEYENPPSVKSKLIELFLSIHLGWVVSSPYQNLVLTFRSATERRYASRVG